MGATRVKNLVDVKIECDPPDWWSRHRYTYGTPEYWKAYQAHLQKWVDDFHAFIRDHRSQDPVSLSVEPVYQDQCSNCGAEWEMYMDDGVMACANCGELVEVLQPAQPGKEG